VRHPAAVAQQLPVPDLVERPRAIRAGIVGEFPALRFCSAPGAGTRIETSVPPDTNRAGSQNILEATNQ
jgi:hypothetical protein